jgi:hypothetical protein
LRRRMVRTRGLIFLLDMGTPSPRSYPLDALKSRREFGCLADWRGKAQALSARSRRCA